MEHGSSALRRFGWVVGVVALAWVGVSWVRAIAPIEAQPNPVIRPTAGWDTKLSNPGAPTIRGPRWNGRDTWRTSCATISTRLRVHRRHAARPGMSRRSGPRAAAQQRKRIDSRPRSCAAGLSNPFAAA